MILIISGPQASGKGTQAELISKKLGLFHMESGEILRNIAKDDIRIREMLNNGILVPSQETINYMESYLNDRVRRLNNIIFDGFPRNLEQYELFKKWLEKNGRKIDKVIYLNISDSEAIKRLSARRIDQRTGKIYNLITEPPGPEVNPGDLVQREDDKPKAIKKRLSIFHDETESMLKKANQEALLIRVDGERPIKVIFEDIMEKLKIKK